MPVGREFPRSPIETVKPVAVRANPETTCAIFAGRDHVGADFSCTGPVLSNGPILVSADQCFRGADPKDTLTILEKRAHKRLNCTAGNLRQFIELGRLCN